jgi:hypothetical protein
MARFAAMLVCFFSNPGFYLKGISQVLKLSFLSLFSRKRHLDQFATSLTSFTAFLRPAANWSKTRGRDRASSDVSTSFWPSRWCLMVPHNQMIYSSQLLVDESFGLADYAFYPVPSGTLTKMNVL